MAALARLVQVTTPDAGAPVVPEGLIAGLPRYEQFCREHWRLDTGDARGLTGLRSGGVLSQQAGATAITFPAGYARLPGGGANGLLTPYDDADDDAWFIVTRTSALNATATYLIGSINSGTASDGGEQLYLASTGAPTEQVRGYATTAAVASSSSPVATGWSFYGQVKRGTVLNQDGTVATQGARTVFAGKGGSLFKATLTGDKKTAASPMRKTAIGNAYRNTAAYREADQDIYEVITFASGVLLTSPGAADDAAVLGIYTRAIQRAATYGLVVG